ncbi:MAG TPA: ABC transporter permease [Longimicrobiales bacterium]|nr:ABC transporter permease [Longimicrobiales bacterium]
MESLFREVRFALRALVKRPGFTAVAVLTLGLGLGANLSIFSLVDAVLLRPPAAVRAPERLVSVWTSDFSGPRYGASSYPDYEAIAAATDAFAGVAASSPRPLSLAGAASSERIFGEMVSGNYFDVLGVRPALGRFFLPEEAGAAGGHPVVVLGWGLWQRAFGGARDVIGRTVRLSGVPLTVVGVAPPGFRGSVRGLALEVWVPFSADRTLLDFGPDERGNRGLFVTARMRPGVTVAEAQARLDLLARQLHSAYPQEWTDVKSQPRVLTAVPERLSRVPPMARGPVVGFMALLMAVVGIVLLIACANVANLLLARATGRQREVAIRLALGATRRRLVRQLLVESLLLALGGGALGVLIARWTTALLAGFHPPIDIPLALDLRVDGAVLGFGLLLAVATAVAFGLAPALRATRPDLVPALKDEGPTVRAAGRRFGLRNLLVVGQVAGSLVLLVAGSLFLRTLRQATHIDAGFDPENLLLVAFDLSTERYDAARAADFYDRLEERVGALPGVRAVSLAERVPLGLNFARRGLVIEGYEKQPGEDMEQAFNVVGANYFRTMGTRLVRGRAIDARDREGAPLAVVVNESFARRFWPGADPLGKRIGWEGPEGRMAEVVGVARDGKYRSLAEEPRPYFYIAAAQAGLRDLTLHARTAGDPRALVPAVRAAVRELAPGLPIANLTTLREQVAVSLLPQRLAAAVLGVLGALALLLAVVGLHGVVAYAVSLRTRELGIRVALGARPADIRRMVVLDGMRLFTIGAALGLGLALATSRLLRGFLLGGDGADPVAFLVPPLLLAAVALLAAYLPARRATRVDPVEALRSQ